MTNTSHELTVATVNTMFGNAVTSDGGLGDAAEADVLLLQEIHQERDDVDANLRKYGMRIAAVMQSAGLIIAVKEDLTTHEAPSELLLHRSKKTLMVVEKLDEKDALAFRMRGRGVVGVSVELDDGQQISVFNTHPPVPIASTARNKHLRLLAEFLNMRAETPFVVGGDMNHWPRPRKKDRQFQADANLRRVDIGEDDTFHGHKSKIAKVIGAIARIQNGQLDSLFYSHSLSSSNEGIIEIDSDHSAVIATFMQ